MQVYQLQQIEKDVRCLMDENEVSTQLLVFGDTDTLEFNNAIRSRVCEAVKYVHSLAPYFMIDDGPSFCDNISWEDRHGFTMLPDDFMRLVVFEMSDWERCVTTLHDMNSSLYAMQRSKYRGLRGSPQKPLCFKSIKDGGRVMEFYSCKDHSATVNRAVYLPYPSIDKNDGVEICPKCYDAFLYYLCGLVFLTYGDSARADIFMTMSKKMLE